MKKFVIISFLLWHIFGCAAQMPLNYQNWNKPGCSIEEFKKDSYACERDALYMPYKRYDPMAGLAGTLFQIDEQTKRTNLFIRCMEAKGWSRQDVPSQNANK